MKRVSKHAHKRGLERGGVSNKKIKEIMMYGYPPACYDGPFHHYLKSVQSTKGGAIVAKVKDDIIVIYNKRSQRAITTYHVPNKFKPSDDYLLPAFRKVKDASALREVGEYLWKYIGGE